MYCNNFTSNNGMSRIYQKIYISIIIIKKEKNKKHAWVRGYDKTNIARYKLQMVFFVFAQIRTAFIFHSLSIKFISLKINIK